MASVQSPSSPSSSLSAFLASSVERNHFACLPASTAWSSELLYYSSLSERKSASQAASMSALSVEPALALARSYYEMKEYRRAAQLLDSHPTPLTSTGHERYAHFSAQKLYFYLYFSLIAGEKLLSESALPDASAEHYSAEYHRLLSIVNAAPSLATHAYLSYLKALLCYKLKDMATCQACCFDSIRLDSGNWSAWKLLSSTLFIEEQLSATFDRLQEAAVDGYFLPFFKVIMYMQFHLYSAAADVLASDIAPLYSTKLPFYLYTLGEIRYSLKGKPCSCCMSQLLESVDWSPITTRSCILSFLSCFLVSHLPIRMIVVLDFAASEKIFCEYMAHHPHALTGLDVYSNLLYVQEDEPTLASLAEHASKLDVYSVVTNVILGSALDQPQDVSIIMTMMILI